MLSKMRAETSLQNQGDKMIREKICTLLKLFTRKAQFNILRQMSGLLLTRRKGGKSSRPNLSIVYNQKY